MTIASRIGYRNRWTCFAAAYAGFWVFYFATNNETWLAPRALPLLPFEARLPLMPWTCWIYILVFAMPLAACAFVETDEDVRELLVAYLSMAAVCTSVFAVFPTIYPRPAGAVPFPLSLIRALDTPKNCFPSQHVSMAFLSAFFIGRQRPFWRLPALALAVAIAVSTLTTKQHYFWDVAGGFTAACVAWRLCARRAPAAALTTPPSPSKLPA